MVTRMIHAHFKPKEPKIRRVSDRRITRVKDRPDILADRKAVVVGGSRGIGQAIAGALSRSCRFVGITGRNFGSSPNSGECYRDAEAEVRCYDLNLESDQSIRNFGRQLSGDIKFWDILVISAGIYLSNKFDDDDVQGLSETFRVNALGPYILVSNLLPLMHADGADLIVINSTAAFGSAAGKSWYAASKRALTGLTDALREEYGRKGLRVTAVFPGRTATDMQARVLEAEGRKFDPKTLLRPEDIADIVLACLRLSDTGEVTEVRIRPRRKLLD